MPALMQPKLTIGPPNDRYEQEADRVADTVMRMPVPGAGPHPSGDPLATDRVQAKPLVQLKTTNSSSGLHEAPSSVSGVLRSPGRPLDAATRGFMEPRFGYDFSQVRVHADARASASAREVNARAYTVGHDIVFGSNQYSPATTSGRQLLAHELTHVVQQQQHSSHTTLQKQGTAPTAPANSTAPVNGGLSDEMLRQIARNLREAMAGLGTDEEAIYASLAGRTQEQANAIKRVYTELFNRSLISDLQDDLNESEMKHLANISPIVDAKGAGTTPAQQSGQLADMIAAQLDKAMDQLGTDEDAIYAALTGRTVAERQAIKAAYTRLTGRQLEADLRDELSGSELTHALMLLNQGFLQPEDQIFLAVTGAGTDEETLFRVLAEIRNDRNKIKNAIDQYAAKGYGNMLDDIHDDLSGSEKEEAIEMLHGLTPSGSCSDEERKTGLHAISKAASMAQNASSKLGADIRKGKLSSRVETVLQRNFNRGKAVGAVNVGLAREVKSILDYARDDLLTLSDITCGALDSCVAKPKCSGEVTFATTKRVKGSTVRLCPAFFVCAKYISLPVVMLHEFVHHSGKADKPNAYAYERGFHSLTPIGDGSEKDSLDNADSYARLAEEIQYD